MIVPTIKGDEITLSGPGGEISMSCGHARRMASEILRLCKGAANEAVSARNKRIVAAYASGEKLDSISYREGLCPATICTIARNGGCRRRTKPRARGENVLTPEESGNGL